MSETEATGLKPKLVAASERLAYRETVSRDIGADLGPLEVYRLMTTRQPGWLNLAFRVRDGLSKPFGVEPIGGFGGASDVEPRVGDRLDFFTVEHLDHHCLVLSSRDAHLDVMLSIDVTRTSSTTNHVEITASVVTHNAFGRLYMVPVKIAHPIIVRALMRNLPVPGTRRSNV